MEDYRSNSLKARAMAEKAEVEVVPEKKLEKIVHGNAVRKKKSSFAKFAEALIQGDITTIKDHVFRNVFMPALKKFIKDSAMTSLDMLFNDPADISRDRSISSKISYTKYSSASERPVRRVIATYQYDEVEFDDVSDAKDALEGMREVIDTYKWCSVGDYYDLLGFDGTSTDGDYGWNNLNNADIVVTGNGKYKLKLPKVVPIP